MKNEVLDFTDYATPIDFKFDDNIYRIPAFNKDQIEKLMELNKNFIDIDEVDDDDSEGQMKKTKDYFEMQDIFIATALMRKKGDGYKTIEPSDLNSWPVKVKNKVMQQISEQMSVTVEDDEPEKKS